MSESNWIEAALADDLPAQDVTAVEIGGREVALYKVEGDVFATDNICTHGRARLCEGFLLGHEVECPLHQGRFDVRDGQPTCEPATDPLRTYPVKIEGGRVYVQIAA